MKESDIRPKNIFDEYLRLSKKDVKLFFKNVKGSNCICPGCGYPNGNHKFNKNSFSFLQCPKCNSLYVSPRPSSEVFDAFYEDSISSKYWSDVFYPTVEESRKKLLIKPKAKKILNLIKGLPKNPVVLDVGCGTGTFLEAIKEIKPKIMSCGIEPSSNMAKKALDKGFNIENSTAENSKKFKNYADLVVCFEVTEHVHNTQEFLSKLTSFCKPGGTVLITSLTCDGFDIKTLWKDSNSVYPPHHINLLSKLGYRSLFESSGLKDIQIITPGKLDADIVKNFFKDKKNKKKLPNFLINILNDENLSKSFQEFLEDNKLSSHIWVFGIKK